jgi:shikimate kinase
MTAKCGEFPAPAARFCGWIERTRLVTRAAGPDEHTPEETERTRSLRALGAKLRIDRPIALIGMMGAGKTSIGKRLAHALDIPFKDADAEIEKAAGCSVAEIFAARGEDEFRDGERRVIARLVSQCPPHVLATGGGAIVNPETRALLKEKAVTIWLRADVDVLLHRVGRRDTRPLLRNGDQRATLARLLAERAPYYAQADFVIESNPGPHSAAVEAALKALATRFEAP